MEPRREAAAARAKRGDSTHAERVGRIAQTAESVAKWVGQRAQRGGHGHGATAHYVRPAKGCSVCSWGVPPPLPEGGVRSWGGVQTRAPQRLQWALMCTPPTKSSTQRLSRGEPRAERADMRRAAQSERPTPRGAPPPGEEPPDGVTPHPLGDAAPRSGTNRWCAAPGAPRSPSRFKHIRKRRRKEKRRTARVPL